MRQGTKRRAFARVGALLVVGTLVSSVVALTGQSARAEAPVVRAVEAELAAQPAHQPGLYLSVGKPTQLMRGRVGDDGSLAFSPVGSRADDTYNALAAHLGTAELYAVSDPDGALVRVGEQGAVQRVASLGATSSVGAFAGGEFADRMYYLPRGRMSLAWVDVVSQQRGEVPLSHPFAPIDMAWNDGYFWGLLTSYRSGVLTRLSLDGEVTTTIVPGFDASRFPGGTFGGAWTYGNGNLGFAASEGGTVQLRILDALDAHAEVVGYSASPASNALDAAMLPDDRADLEVRVEPSPAAANGSVRFSVAVRNVGGAPSSGYQLRFGPDDEDDRVVSAPQECAAGEGELAERLLLCAGGPLRPGSERTHEFVLHAMQAGSAFTRSWSASVQGNEEDPDPANSVVRFDTPGSVPVPVDIEMKVRVLDDDRNGLPDPGERIQAFGVVTNRSGETLRGATVHAIGGQISGSAEIAGDIAPEESRTVLIASVLPDLGDEPVGSIRGEIRAFSAGVPIRSASLPVIVLGSYATPWRFPAETPPPGIWRGWEPPASVVTDGPVSDDDSGTDSAAGSGARADASADPSPGNATPDADGAEADARGDGDDRDAAGTAGAGAGAGTDAGTEGRDGSGSGGSEAPGSSASTSARETVLAEQRSTTGSGGGRASELAATGAKTGEWVPVLPIAALALGLLFAMRGRSATRRPRR